MKLKCDLQPKAYYLEHPASCTHFPTKDLPSLNDTDPQRLLQSEILQNDVLKRQIKELEMQLDLANIKIIVSQI